MTSATLDQEASCTRSKSILLQKMQQFDSQGSRGTTLPQEPETSLDMAYPFTSL